MAAEDVVAITNLINLYGLAMDSQNWDLFDRIYTPDADVDFGGASHWTDLAKFKSDFDAFHSPFDATQHLMAGHVVDLTGDSAKAFTYGYWRLLRRGIDGGDTWEGSGWYDDQLTRTQQGWRIVKRVCRVTWWAGNPLVQEVFPGVKFSMTTTSPRAEFRAGRLGFLS